ncbi:MAG: VTT domain-containing protein [bacterium]|nr:VTT domain-containing protein [bacterium]
MLESVPQLLQSYPLLAPLIFIFIRSLAIIFPPIPGIILDAVGIAFFGWKIGLIYAEIGVVGGAMVAFWIARKFREPVVRRFITLQKLHTWEDTLSERKKFWSLVGLRIVTGPLLFDYINYIAGLTKINPIKFLGATVIGTMPAMLIIYYFGDRLLAYDFNFVIIFVVIILTAGLIQRRWYKKHFIKK